MQYKAFISYSHSAHREVVEVLHRDLERLGRSMFQLRSIRVFRDKTDLSAQPELWPVIREALNASEYLIYVATPEAAASGWVRKELATWIDLNDGAAENLLVLLLEGSLEWSAENGDFNWSVTDAVPRFLDANNTVPIAQHLKGEPLYVDLRWARRRSDLSLRDPLYFDAVTTLASTLRNRPKAEMIYADAREQRRSVRSWQALSVLSIITLVAVALGAREIMRVRQVRAEEMLTDQRVRKTLSTRRASALLGEVFDNLSTANLHMAYLHQMPSGQLWPKQSFLDTLQLPRAAISARPFSFVQYAALQVQPEVVPDEVWGLAQSFYDQLRHTQLHQQDVFATIENVVSASQTKEDFRLAVTALLVNVEASYHVLRVVGENFAVALEKSAPQVSTNSEVDDFIGSRIPELIASQSDAFESALNVSIDKGNPIARALRGRVEMLGEGDISGHVGLAASLLALEDAAYARRVFELILQRFPNASDMCAYAEGGIFRIDHPEHFTQMKGVVVTLVEDGSSAANAEVQPGDSLLMYNSRSLSSYHDLTTGIAHNPAENATLTVLRGEDIFQVNVPAGRLGVAVMEY